jgi:hypothetical protein
MILSRIVEGAIVPWEVTDADAKLDLRASLPGAYGYDQAAHALRALQAEGARAIDLLPLALPTSWMVNAKASSRAFRAWLTPPALVSWQVLLDLLPFDMAADTWPAHEDRDQVLERVSRLAAVEGAGLAAVSKVLALLRPQLVPLMDDAALAFAIGAVAMPTQADQATAGAACFGPMMDWFSAQVLAGEAELVQTAARHRANVLDAAQVLDRLLWMDAWGVRYFT